MKLKQSDFSYKQIYFYQLAVLGATQEEIKMLKLQNDIALLLEMIIQI